MRILFLSNLYPPNIVGGYERICFDVASGLASRGHQVKVLTSDYGGKVEDFTGQIVERTLKLIATEGDIYQPFNSAPEQRTAMNIHNIGTLTRNIEEFEPDVIFVWNLFFFDPSLLDAIKQMKELIVYLLTDNWLISFLNPSFLQGFFTQRVYNYRSSQSLYLNVKRLLTRRRKPNLALPGHAIFPSQYMRDLYTEAELGFESKTIIYHGVDLSRYPENDFADRTRLLQDGEVRLLVAGRIVEVKGIHTVIEALPSIIRRLPDLKVKLTVRGDDRDRPYVERLQAQVAQLGLGSKIEFDKPVSQVELFNLFQSHDIYLFPSLYEPFALTLIQAMAAGIPTIASSAGGNAEMVQHMQTGLLFPPAHARKLAEAVVQLTAEGRLRQSISERARNIARQYTSSRMVSQIEQALENVREKYVLSALTG